MVGLWKDMVDCTIKRTCVFFCGFNTQEGEQLVNDWLGWLGLFPLLFGVEVGSWSGWDVVGMGLFVSPTYIYIFLIFELFIHVYVFLNAFFIIRKKSTLSLCACCYFKIEPEPCGDFPIVGNLSICMGKSIFWTCFVGCGLHQINTRPWNPHFCLQNSAEHEFCCLNPGESPSTKYLQILLLESLWNFTCSWLTHHGSCLTFHFYWLISHFYW